MSRTVKVRIAVAVDENGDATCKLCCDEADDIRDLFDCIPRIFQRAAYIVSVELPIPTPTEVPGEVERWATN